MGRLRIGLPLIVVLAAAGCNNDRGNESQTATSIATLDTGSSSAESADTGDIKLDVEGGGTGQASAEGGDEGCKKVDFLFVIDSSRSMTDEQANLLASFPGFINAIESTLMIDDFHLMVVDAGLLVGAGCDGTLGAGQITSATGQDCGLVGGNRYATQAQPDLTAAFSCMGSRGAAGPGNEQTMQSMMQAIGPLTATGQCNDGFLRDDAILVLTIITDEEDDPNDTAVNPPLDGSCVPADSDTNSTGDPMSWHTAVVTAKNGDATAAVVLSLIGDCDVGGMCPGIADDTLNPDNITGAEPAPRVRQFTQLFGFGTLGPVCAPDYSPFFEDAVAVIESACDGFMPPG